MKSRLVDKVCEVCGASFSVIPSRALSAKTCGLECRGKLIGMRYQAARPTINCKECGEEFSSPACQADRRVYCSMECADKHRGDHTQSGEASPNWRGGKSFHSDGYVYLATPEHPYATVHSRYVFEHRLVVEQLLREKDPEHHFLVRHGQHLYLAPEIHVHHIDEDKRNNAPENLLACTAGAHANIHNGIAPMKGHVWPEIEGLVPAEPYRVSVECQTCGTEFEAKRSDVAIGRGKYCSQTCFVARERKPFEIRVTH